MNRQRMRDVVLGFLLCLALVVSYQCGASSHNSNSTQGSTPTKGNTANPFAPTSAHASSMTSDYAIVGGVDAEGDLGFVVVDKQTGRVVFSERIPDHALPTASRLEVRYW